MNLQITSKTLSKFLTLISIGSLLSSCGLYQMAFRPTVNYTQQTLSNNSYRLEHFPDVPTAFNTQALETIVDSIDYKGSATVKVLIDNSGNVKDLKTMKNNLRTEDFERITETLKETKWLPFVGSPYGISSVTFDTGRDLIYTPENRGWVTLLWPRPTTKAEL